MLKAWHSLQIFDEGRPSEAELGIELQLCSTSGNTFCPRQETSDCQGQLSRGAFTDNRQLSCLPRNKTNNPTLCPTALFALNTATCFSSRFVKERKQFFY